MMQKLYLTLFFMFCKYYY